jgi:hypothetical protein
MKIWLRDWTRGSEGGRGAVGFARLEEETKK